MTTIEKTERTRNNVTNLADVRLARAEAKSQHDLALTADAFAEDSSDTDPKNTDRHANRRFDAEKVARIKAAIASGEYVIDPSRVADRFIEHDRNQ